jgi:scyllo-inositol 2-dehydrogenase (NADP+)
MLKFGIIGFGFMGQTHAETIAKLDFAELVAVCDTNALQLKHAPEGVQTFLKAEDLLDTDINTVIISVPNHLHLEMVKKVAEAGKDIICEKPAAMNAAEFAEMMTVTQAANVRFTIHHQRRWDRDFRIAKEVYDSGTLGEIFTIKNSLYGFNGNMHDWHVYPEFGGGMLYDWGVHLLDQILYMLAPSRLESVYATVRNVINKNVDDYFNIQLYFENGITAQVELGTYMLSEKENWFERHWFLGGDQGSANIDGFDPKGSITRTTALLQSVGGKTTMTPAGPTRSFGPPPAGRIVSEELPEVFVNHEMFFENYLRFVQGKEELVVKPNQIYQLMQLVDAIRESAATHQVVTMKESGVGIGQGV